MTMKSSSFVVWIVFLQAHLVLSVDNPLCLHDISFLFHNLGCSRTGVADTILKVGQAQPDANLNSHPESYGMEDFSPWSYPPVCTGQIDKIGSELCVYTDTSFSNGRGVSIFTTPRIAAEFSALPAFHDPTALDGINDSDKPWYTKEISGKGIGVVASRKIKRGELLTAYTPVLLSHQDKELSTLEREQFMRTAIAQLPAESQRMYLNLATIYGIATAPVQDVAMANAYEIEVGGKMHLAVYPETSRINHDCASKYVHMSLNLILI